MKNELARTLLAAALALSLVLAGCKSIPAPAVERPEAPVMACAGTLV